MKMDKFTIKAQEALMEAQNAADQRGHQEIGAEHILLALLQQHEGIVTPILQKIGANPQAVQSQVEGTLDRMPKVSGVTGQLYMSPAMKGVLDKAWDESQSMKDEYMSTEHLLIGISDSMTEAARKGKLDPVYGARPLKRTIQRRIQDPLAMKVLDGSHVLVDASDSEIFFTATHPDPEPEPVPVA